MADIAIYAPILDAIVSWSKDQSEHFSTTEIRLNFTTSEIECYDYESGIVNSTRPLNYFAE